MTGPAPAAPTGAGRPAGRLVWMALGLVALAGWAWRSSVLQQQQQQRERGQAIFEGRAQAPGRLVGHAEALPALATRCANCHAAPAPLPQALAAGAAASASFATPLGRDGLSQPRSRRGGPPSAFDGDSLCRLLRDGVDPAAVIVSTTMPRYTLSTADCADLWAYLLTR